MSDAQMEKTDDAQDNDNRKSGKRELSWDIPKIAGERKPHKFEETRFTKPTFCEFCSSFIWGISGKQGYSCVNEGCKYAIHKACLEKVPKFGCPKELHTEPTSEELKSAFAQELDASTSFGLFGPSNPNEVNLMSNQIEAKIIEDIKAKHKPRAPKIFDLSDACDLITDAASHMVEDEFTNCFLSPKPKPWNWNIYLFPMWVCGVLLRYLILFPIRLLVLLVGSLIVAFAFGISFSIPNRSARHEFQLRIIRFYSAIFIASWSGVIRYHGTRPQKRPNQVFVANHTTIFDIVVLQQNFCFAIVGQRHPGIMGFFQTYVLDCLGCLWFDRADSGDRSKLSELIKKHVRDPTKLPLLLFPEGTCVNNDYCVMFKKGAFELGATVYPIAIKYNKVFCDPFYNSREQSFLRHVFRLMTNWAVVCDVWYIEPQTIQPGESVIEFTERVKDMIAKKAGLRNVAWDGYLKYFRPSEKFIDERRKVYASSLIKKFSQNNLLELEAQYLSQQQGQELRRRAKSTSFVQM